MKSNKILMAGALALSMVLSGGMLTGCSNSSTKDTKTTEVAKKKEVKTHGKKTKDSKSLKFTNNTGKKITVFETKSSSEEKKEETAKADSSNKSNASESKKDNTASTTNTSSNKNNTSSSKPSNSSNSSNSNSSKPAEHTHNWVAQYKTVNVPEKGHNEQVLVQAAYDEQVPITEMKEICVGNQSRLQINGDPNEYLSNNSNGDSGWHSEWRETVVGYKTVHHEAVYETRYVVDSPATTKQELTGYKCSGCGKTKAN